jgi:hypothetical protein
VNEHGEEIDPWQFKKGKAVELGCVPRFPIDVPGRPLDFCWAAFSIPLVQARFVSLFERLGVRDVQFIPAWVEGHSEPSFILNALRIICCIDDARCEEVQSWMPGDSRPDKVGQYRAGHGLRIDPAKVEGACIFRPWGWTVALIISEDLKQAMEEERLGGRRIRIALEVHGVDTTVVRHKQPRSRDGRSHPSPRVTHPPSRA